MKLKHLSENYLQILPSSIQANMIAELIATGAHFHYVWNDAWIPTPIYGSHGYKENFQLQKIADQQSKVCETVSMVYKKSEKLIIIGKFANPWIF